jgi:NAD(P)H-flavin reductase
VIMGVNGSPQRVCREGPVFAAEEVAWEAGW